jgi:hypothetical protein
VNGWAEHVCSARVFLLTYLGERNIAIFSTDIDSRDFKTIAAGTLRTCVKTTS